MGKGSSNPLQGDLARESSPGLTMSDLLTLPGALSGLLNRMIRQGQVTVAEAAALLGQDEVYARTVLANLCARGFVRQSEREGVAQYCVCLAPKHARPLPSPLWQALDEKPGPGEERR